jgi:hypothetical protein
MTPRGQEVLERFMKEWLRYDDVRTIAKDEATVPGFSAIRDDMAEETRTFLSKVLFERKGSIAELFSAKTTTITPALARHYGLSGSGTVDRPDDQAIGILAHGSILSRYALTQASSPPQRGALVRRRLFCQNLPSPPPNAGEPPVPRPGLTTRELYENAHSASQPSCAGCHQAIDPIGFGLEHFDVAGRYRTTEGGKPIDASGEITGESDATFADHRALAEILGASPRVADCVGGLMATYAFGSADGKGYTLKTSREALASRLPLVEYFAQIAAAPHFAVRWED